MAQIIYWALNFAPQYWASCNGALLPTAQYSALYSLLGTAYGGDGTNTFGLPDLRGRVPVGMGQGQNTSNYSLAQSGGFETITLTQTQMPAHNHSVQATSTSVQVKASNQAGTQSIPGNVGASTLSSLTTAGLDPVFGYNTDPSPGVSLTGVSLSGSFTTGNTGGSQSHENRMPYLVLNPCISVQGLYPARP